MAAYTQVSDSELAEFLGGFEFGDLTSFSPISAGIENSNYAVSTDRTDLVLTLFEHHSAVEVEEFVRLGRHLRAGKFNVPAPLPDKQGVWLHELHARPAILCERFPGHHPQNISTRHCELIGAALADFHLRADDLPDPRLNQRGYDWWVSAAPELSADLPKDDQALMQDELAFQTQHLSQWQALPSGWIHADLFHDNALFLETRAGLMLSAIIDLYNACDGARLYDLAVVANDWCSPGWKPSNPLEPLKADHVSALVEAYHAVRPLTADEMAAWPLVLRGASLRFWLSRLLTKAQVEKLGQSLPGHKNPAEYRDRLKMHRSQTQPLSL